MNEQIVPDITGEQVINPSTGEVYVSRATDPVMLPTPYASPSTFAAQYPTPLDPTEIIALCEEVSLWQALPEEFTSLKAHTWREMNSIAFVSGSTYLFFADGMCPEEYAHTGNNLTVTLKNLGSKKSLSISDIMHSAAVAGANWHGINRLVGGFPAGEGAPGGTDTATFAQERVMDIKEKEIRVGMTLVLNGWDRYLIRGDTNTNSLEFNGLDIYDTRMSNCSFHTNSGEWSASGSFSALGFDRWLAEACAKPTHLFGHPQSMQELMSAYFALGFNGSQVVNFASGDRIVPGFNFSGFVNTSVGRLAVTSDNNFVRTAAGSNLIQSNIYALRMNHNGAPLVYKLTQIPLALKDLTPGCTAIAFEIWVKTALIVKACCAQGRYTGNFTGRIVATCSTIG